MKNNPTSILVAPKKENSVNRKSFWLQVVILNRQRSTLCLVLIVSIHQQVFRALETEDLDPNLSLPLPRNNQLSHLELSEQSDSSMRIVEHHEHNEQGTNSNVLRVIK